MESATSCAPLMPTGSTTSAPASPAIPTPTQPDSVSSRPLHAGTTISGSMETVFAPVPLGSSTISA